MNILLNEMVENLVHLVFKTQRLLLLVSLAFL